MCPGVCTGSSTRDMNVLDRFRCCMCLKYTGFEAEVIAHMYSAHPPKQVTALLAHGHDRLPKHWKIIDEDLDMNVSDVFVPVDY